MLISNVSTLHGENRSELGGWGLTRSRSSSILCCIMASSNLRLVAAPLPSSPGSSSSSSYMLSAGDATVALPPGSGSLPRRWKDRIATYVRPLSPSTFRPPRASQPPRQYPYPVDSAESTHPPPSAPLLAYLSPHTRTGEKASHTFRTVPTFAAPSGSFGTTVSTICSRSRCIILT